MDFKFIKMGKSAGIFKKLKKKPLKKDLFKNLEIGLEDHTGLLMKNHY